MPTSEEGFVPGWPFVGALAIAMLAATACVTHSPAEIIDVGALIIDFFNHHWVRERLEFT